MKHELYLASESPRRRELLSQAGYIFHKDSVKLSEIVDKNLNPAEAVKALAREKAEAFADQHKHLKSQNNLILAADTMVVLRGQLMGKPINLEQAREFLDQLSGKTHSVITGFCLIDLLSGRQVTECDETLVLFKSLTAEEIETYLKSGEPMGKAGAYAIQGKGAKLVENYEGSWSNVVGLPLEKLEKVLQENAWYVEKTKT